MQFLLNTPLMCCWGQSPLASCERIRNAAALQNNSNHCLISHTVTHSDGWCRVQGTIVYQEGSSRAAQQQPPQLVMLWLYQQSCPTNRCALLSLMQGLGVNNVPASCQQCHHRPGSVHHVAAIFKLTVHLGNNKHRSDGNSSSSSSGRL